MRTNAAKALIESAAVSAAVPAAKAAVLRLLHAAIVAKRADAQAKIESEGGPRGAVSGGGTVAVRGM